MKDKTTPATPEDGPPGSGGWQSHAEAIERERDYWRERARVMEAHQRGEVWYWQGDGGDHPESMVNSLPVVIRADQLRDFADRTHALRMQAAPKAASTLPEGWTDCTIEFGNDGPEVVAYGPKRMMDRLAKWLGKYFAQVIADAAPKAAPGEPCWWRKRAEEIEAQVALAGSPEAMRCYTDMRTLLQAATEAAPLPLLVRDIAADFGVAPLQVISAAEVLGFGNLSVNMAVTSELAKALRKHFEAAPQPAPAELEQLRGRVGRIGLDIDRALHGQVNEQSPVGAGRLAAIAALAKPAPAPLSESDYKRGYRDGYERRDAEVRGALL